MIDVPIIAGSEWYIGIMAVVALYRVVKFLINLL